MQRTNIVISSRMAQNAQRRGQLSPPDSVSDDEAYNRAQSSRHHVAVPYNTPPMNAVQAYVSNPDLYRGLINILDQHYADPEQYGLQDDQAYYGNEVRLAGEAPLDTIN